MLAAKRGHEEVVKYLISKGVNVLQKDNVSDMMTHYQFHQQAVVPLRLKCFGAC